MRFSFYILFIIFLLNKTQTLAGYTLNQTLIFFLTFNIIDVVSQTIFRGVYQFRPLVIDGGFDLILAKPMSALFRALMGGADVIDMVTIPPLIVLLFLVGKSLEVSLLQAFLYLLLIFNGLIISTAFHIAVMALGIITLEIDHTIMIYRDLTSLGRFPIDIYKEPLKSILTFVIPVGVMVTLPAKALIGLISPVGVLISFVVGILAIFLSARFWKYALRFYTSASS